MILSSIQRNADSPESKEAKSANSTSHRKEPRRRNRRADPGLSRVGDRIVVWSASTILLI